MISHLTSKFSKRVRHPIFFGLIISAGVFGAGGFVIGEVTGNGTAAAFFVIYAMMASAMGGLGYAALIISSILKRFRSDMDRSV